MLKSTLNGYYTNTITPGSNGYASTLTFVGVSDSQQTYVKPMTVGADGVFSNVAGVNVTIGDYVAVLGGPGSATAAGGIGVDLTASATLTLDPYTGTHLGGVVGGSNYAGGAAGAGVSMTGGGQLYNNGNIFAGTSTNGTGAVGVVAAGGTVVTNTGLIHGGFDEQNNDVGGVGLQLTGNAQLANTGSGYILGGNGFASYNSSGGVGMVASGAGVTGTDSATIQGGSASGSGQGGAGLQLSNGASLTVTGSGNIHGGTNSYVGSRGTYSAGGRGGTAAEIYSGATLTVQSGGYLRAGQGYTPGVGVYIDGGTLVTSGVIKAGQDATSTQNVYIYGNAIVFGPAAGSRLVLNAGSFIENPIAGFGANDTIDAKNWTPSGTYQPFTSSTYQLATGDGTLNFTGLTVGDRFAFTADGSGGTDITLAGPGGATVNQQIVIGSAAYPSPLVLGAGGQVYTVLPSGEGGVTAVVTNLSSSTLTVNANGSVTGGAGSNAGGVFVAGNGVTLGNSNVTVNAGATVTGGYGNTGVKGGIGVDITATQAQALTGLTNDGVITGGAGNLGGGGGVFFSSLASATNGFSPFVNDGKVYGGSAYAGARFGSAAAGGYGVTVDLGQDQVQNDGVIQGGAGGVDGGAGLIVEYGASAVNETGGSIVGGTASNSGVGGVGVELVGGGIVSTHGSISGGGAGGTTGYAVTFNYVPGAGSNLEELRVYAGASFVGNIGGFGQPGSYVDIANWEKSGTSAAFTSSTVTLDTPDGNLTFTGLTVGDRFVYNQFGVSGTSIQVACFRPGTRIRCERGQLPIETLKIGDRVITLAGVVQPIKWIGRRRYSRECAAGNPEILPIKIARGALGGDLPSRDLWVSPEHALYIDGMLIPAAALVNGSSIAKDESVEDVTYLHLEFDAHAVIFAEGAPAESFVDDDSRQMFDNAAEYARLYPDAVGLGARFWAPRVEDGEELEAVRRRLGAEAASSHAAFPSALDPAGRRLDPAGRRAAPSAHGSMT